MQANFIDLILAQLAKFADQFWRVATHQVTKFKYQSYTDGEQAISAFTLRAPALFDVCPKHR